MRVNVTLDKYDGSKSKAKQLDMDGMGMNELMFMMMNGDVCGCTITKCKPLTKAVERSKGGAS